jgi:hypothetical protein
MSMEKNADLIFSYTDGDGDSVEFLATADYRLTLTANSVGHQPTYVYMDARAVDGLIDALQYWRGLRQQEVVAPTEEPVATCIMCPHSSLAHGPGLGCRMCPCAIGSTRAERPAETRAEPEAEVHPTPQESLTVRTEALSLAVQLHSRSPFEHDSGDHALDLAEEFSHWLLTGGRSSKPDIGPETACSSCLHGHGDDGCCHFMTGTAGACACPLGTTAVEPPYDSLCLICRHAYHGKTHCGVRAMTGLVVERCKCTGVATA